MIEQQHKLCRNAHAVIQVCNELIGNKAWESLLPKRHRGEMVFDDDGEIVLSSITDHQWITIDTSDMNPAVCKAISRRFKYQNRSGACSPGKYLKFSGRNKGITGLQCQKLVLPYLAYLRSLLEVLCDHIPGILKGLSVDELIPVLTIEETEKFVDFAKYSSAYPAALYLSLFPNNPEERPLPEPKTDAVDPWFFTGVLRRRLRSMVKTRSNGNKSVKATRTWFAWLFSKRGCLKVPTSFVQKALLSHSETLSTPPPPLPAEQEPEIDRTIQEVIDWLIPDSRDFSRECQRFGQPRVRASYGSTRGDGGHMREVGYATACKTTPLAPVIESDDVRADLIKKMHEFYPEQNIDELYCDTRTEPLLLYGDSGFQIAYGFDNDFSRRIEDAFLDLNGWGDEPMLVRISPVIEPLKVRTVSAGSSLRYMACQGIQDALRRRVSRANFGDARTQVFILTGQPIDKEVVQGISSKLGPLWTSGDYKGATDYLSITITKKIFECILRKIHFKGDERAKQVWRSALYEQTLVYPTIKVNFEPLRVPQRNGQLMGSPESFPVLCIANFVEFVLAVRDVHPDMPLEEICECVRINGDDIAFSCDSPIYRAWELRSASFGFKKSIGKNYVNPTYMVINSTVWDMRTREQIHHLNVGFLTGQSRTTGREETRGLALHDYWENLCHDGNAAYRLGRFIMYNKNEIRRITHGEYNLFLPRLLGGAGFRHGDKVLRDGGHIEYTPRQKAIASRLYEVLTSEHKASLPLPRGDRLSPRNYALSAYKGKVASPALLHGSKCRNSRYPGLFFVHDDEEDSYMEFMAPELDDKHIVVHRVPKYRKFVHRVAFPVSEAEYDPYVLGLDKVTLPLLAHTVTEVEQQPIRIPSWCRNRVKHGDWTVDPSLGFETGFPFHPSNIDLVETLEDDGPAIDDPEQGVWLDNCPSRVS